MRSGVDGARRRSAAVEELLRAGLEGVWVKREGLRWAEMDFMVRMVVVRLGLEVRGKRVRDRTERVDEGRRKDGGSAPQLRGALGGIVLVGGGC